MDFNLLRIQLFLILSSQADLEDKMACLMDLLQNEHKKVQRKTAEEVLTTLFKMCSADLTVALT